MNFTEQQSLQFRKLLKALKLSQKALISGLNNHGYQLDATVLSSALNQRRPLPDAYKRGITQAIADKIEQQPAEKQPMLQGLFNGVFALGDTEEADEDEGTTSPENIVIVPPGAPLPANCTHYIKRHCDTELKQQLQQPRPLILITAPPKMGVTSLLNQAESWLKRNKPKRKVIRLDLLQNWAQFKTDFDTKLVEVTDQSIKLNHMYALLVYSLAEQLNQTAEVRSKIDHLLSLNREEHQFMLPREVAQAMEILLNSFSDICLFIDNLDKLLHQGLINLSVHTQLLWFLRDSLAVINPNLGKYWRVICVLSPFVWFQDHHVSVALRQAATNETQSLDHFEVQDLYRYLRTPMQSNNYAGIQQPELREFSSSSPDVATIQNYTEQLAGVPFLLHYLLTQTQSSNLPEAFAQLKQDLKQTQEQQKPDNAANTTVSALKDYKTQLQQLGEVFSREHGELKKVQNTDDNPMQINQLLQKLGLLNPKLAPEPENGQFTLNFDICIGN